MVVVKCGSIDEDGVEAVNGSSGAYCTVVNEAYIVEGVI
ncbi:hypothetical protein MBFIL_10650 [Methanobrevibacter filiformis]|uniref:Uncharacterized protein n=1 Tax=Methanobrevibacter filiformis TaxID=55758 RepID=A0A166B0Y0_9EURY|nr:hypothetical protein MBFIL_10650 [Methanobrevibacter filiformis]